MKNDSLATRIKRQYEDRFRHYLPRRSYTIIRIDGKAFHTYTANLVKPFDTTFTMNMMETAKYLCKNIQGAEFAYVFSDEISILLTDFKEITTEAWFDNNLQKMCSVSASMATAYFNYLRLTLDSKNSSLALFDSRVFQIPDRTEVENYFIQRQQDCTRNSISATAQTLYSHKQLHGKNSSELQEMISKAGINWNDYAVVEKRGSLIVKVPIVKRDDEKQKAEWSFREAPIFTRERQELIDMIPSYK
jgi:tRNA(His) guanylyltransferase